MALPGFGRAPENMVSVAAQGAGSLASITSVVPLGALMTMKCPPPSPEAAGFMMPWHSAVVTVASTALPPWASTSTPAHQAATLGRGSPQHRVRKQ